MKLSKYIIMLIVAGLLVASCSLDRSNPLDPEGNDITVPAQVTGLTIPQYSYQSVNLTWNALDGIPTYYIYRTPNYYDGLYVRVDTVYATLADSVYVSHEDFDEELFSGNHYFYKVSAVNEEKLEGEPSNFVYTYYTNGNGKKLKEIN